MLGINVGEFMQASNTDQFFMIANGLQNIENAAMRSGIGLALLGEAGHSVNAFLAQGATDISKMKEALRDVAPIESTTMATRELVQHLVVLRNGFRNLTADMAAMVVPGFSKVAGVMRHVIGHMRWLNQELPALTYSVAALAGAFITLGGVLVAAGGLSFAAGQAAMLLVNFKALIAASTILTSVTKVLGVVFASTWAKATLGLSILIPLLLQSKWVVWALLKVWGLLEANFGFFVKQIGKLIALIPGMYMFGKAIESWGKSVEKAGLDRIGESFEDYKNRTKLGSDPEAALQSGKFTGNLSSVGVGGGFASQQSLGLGGATGTISLLKSMDESLRENTHATKQMRDAVENQSKMGSR